MRAVEDIGNYTFCGAYLYTKSPRLGSFFSAYLKISICPGLLIPALQNVAELGIR